MSDVIDQIKRLIPISALLNTTEKKIRCPLPDHPDKHPSCDVDHTLNLWHCWGCDNGGTIFDLLMHRDGKTFGDALRELAYQAGVTLDKKQGKEAQSYWDQKKRAERALEYAANYYHSNLLKHHSGLEYLKNRGIELETIQRQKLGWSDGNLTRSVKRANLDGISLDDFIYAGLIRPYEKDPNTHFDYFDERIIFPLLYKNRVLNLSGRKTELSRRTEKYIHLSKFDIDNFYNEDAIKKEIWLFEGHPDTVIGIQCGLPAVGVIGTGGMKHPERLARCQKIYICGDADNAGQMAMNKWAMAILEHNAMCDVLCVSLPAGIKDFNEWYLQFRGQGFAAAFESLMGTAKNLIQFRISQLEVSDQLINIWPLLEPLTEIQREGFFQKIKHVLKGISIKHIRSDYKQYTLSQAAKVKTGSAIGATDLQFKKSRKVNIMSIDISDTNPPVANVCMYGTVTRTIDGEQDQSYEPIIIFNTVNPDGTYKPEAVDWKSLDPSGLDRSTLPLPSVVEGRWSDESLQKFLKGELQPENTARLVKDITQYLRKYIWHTDPATHEILALYAIGTYAARLFGAYPYLSLNGLAGSGKSNTLDLMALLCFNSIFTANISPAALFRSIEQNFPTCIRDEAEQFNKRTPENIDELTMLNAGYKSGAKVIRTGKSAKGEFEVEEFDLFSPKIFAGINMLNDTLLTRSILIKMFKAPKDVVKAMPKMVQTRHIWEKQGAELRDRIYVWLMTKFPLLKQIFKEYVPIDEIANRDWEVWLPLLSIAGLADMEDEQRSDDDEMLTTRIIRTAIIKGKEKKDMAQDNAIEQKVLSTILELLDDLQEKHFDPDTSLVPVFDQPNWYPTSSVCKQVSAKLVEEGFFKDTKEITPRWLIKILEQCLVITDKEEQIKKMWVAADRKQLRCINLTKSTIEEALNRL